MHATLTKKENHFHLWFNFRISQKENEKKKIFKSVTEKKCSELTLERA